MFPPEGDTLELDGLTGSFSSVMYPGGGVSVTGNPGVLSGTTVDSSSNVGNSCSMFICNCKSFSNKMVAIFKGQKLKMQLCES